jgi:hypothetical protein
MKNMDRLSNYNEIYVIKSDTFTQWSQSIFSSLNTVPAMIYRIHADWRALLMSEFLTISSEMECIPLNFERKFSWIVSGQLSGGSASSGPRNFDGRNAMASEVLNLQFVGKINK